MKKQIIKCDRCGEDISPDVLMYGCSSHIEFTLRYWHGGSIGGKEDEDNFELDLCDDCSRSLSYNIRNWLKTKIDFKEKKEK